MPLWAISAAGGLAVVWGLSWLEPKDGADHLPLAAVLGRAALFIALAIAFHAALDPDHDKRTFQLHMPQIARAAYAFAVTSTFLLAFPSLRIHWGALLVLLAIGAMEALQAAHVLPGQFRLIDGLSACWGVGAAAGPMWIGAHRARRNVAREQAEWTLRLRRDKSANHPI